MQTSDEQHARPWLKFKQMFSSKITQKCLIHLNIRNQCSFSAWKAESVKFPDYSTFLSFLRDSNLIFIFWLKRPRSFFFFLSSAVCCFLFDLSSHFSGESCCSCWVTGDPALLLGQWILHVLANPKLKPWLSEAV